MLMDRERELYALSLFHPNAELLEIIESRNTLCMEGGVILDHPAAADQMS